MRIALKDIEAAAANRPAGYREETLAAGTVDGDWLVITAAEYAKLFAKYRGADVPVFERNIASAVTKFQANCPTCGQT